MGAYADLGIMDLRMSELVPGRLSNREGARRQRSTGSYLQAQLPGLGPRLPVVGGWR